LGFWRGRRRNLCVELAGDVTNVRLSLLPTEVKATIAATEIKDAMRPYSIAWSPSRL